MKLFSITFREPVIKSAKEQGFEVIPLVNSTKMSGLFVQDPLNALEICQKLIDYGVRFGDKKTICVGLGDLSSQVATLVNNTLGFSEFPLDFFSLEKLRNKLMTREALGGNHPLNPSFKVANSVADISEFHRLIDCDIIVKPLDASGSKGVITISNMKDKEISSNEAFHDLEFPVLVEEKIVGAEYSVEILFWDGNALNITVTQKTLGGVSGVIEIQQTQPADISKELTQRLFSAAQTVLKQVGFNYGLSHTEFIVTPDGDIKLIESHGRVGGDRIADLMKYTVGKDAFQLLFEAIANKRLPDINHTKDLAVTRYYDLRNFEDTDDVWKNQILQFDTVKTIDVLVNQSERQDFVSSSTRHALIIFAGEKNAVESDIYKTRLLTGEKI